MVLVCALWEDVQCEYVCTNRTSFQTPSGTLTMHVAKNVVVSSKMLFGEEARDLPTLSTVFAVE